MSRHGTQTIETERLILRPFAPEDAPAMYRNWASDPQVTEFLTWPTHPDPGVTAKVIGSWIERAADPGFYQWVLEPKELGEPIGSISVVRTDVRGPVLEGEIGYCMGKAWWGQGLMPEALRAVMDYLFDSEGFTRLMARHSAENPKSGRVMQKAGMTRVGVMRMGDFCNHGVTDMVIYEMLPEDPRT